jgi:hypothetical protein
MVMGAVNNKEVLKTWLKANTKKYQAGMDLEDEFQVFIT